MQHRLFKLLLEDEDVQFTYLLLHTEVRWLSRGTEGREQLEAIFEVDHTSPFIQPASINKRYLYAPYKERKPCIWLKGMWPDERRRMFVCNILSKMAHQL
ncbi:hypothetical protein TNCT_198211, partial [Trichonephila clavata]